MKKTNKKNINILKNQQFKLGSIINPIIEPIIIEPIIIKPIIIDPNIINNINIDNDSNNNVINEKLNFEPIKSKESIESAESIESKESKETIEIKEYIINPIDLIFGSVNDKTPSPIKDIIEKHENINNNNNNNNNIDYLKQIYPPLILNNSLLPSKLENQLYSNIEIKSKIDKLSENEMFEIFKIIKNNKEKYSTNKNGIFINISTLKKITINELCNFLNFCDNNNIIFDNEEKTRDIYREMLL
jgi:hypothetical protein